MAGNKAMQGLDWQKAATAAQASCDAASAFAKTIPDLSMPLTRLEVWETWLGHRSSIEQACARVQRYVSTMEGIASDVATKSKEAATERRAGPPESPAAQKGSRESRGTNTWHGNAWHGSKSDSARCRPGQRWRGGCDL